MARTKESARKGTPAAQQQRHIQTARKSSNAQQPYQPLAGQVRAARKTTLAEQPYQPLAARAGSGSGPLTLQELKDLCRQRGLPVTGTKTVLLERLGGKGQQPAGAGAGARTGAAGVRKPPASHASSGRFVVWHRSEWQPDGWHSYQGPGPVHIDSVHTSKAAANKAVKARFYEKNPYGLDADELTEGEDVDEEWNDGLLTLTVSPPDSETWTVGAKLAGDDD